MELRQLRYFVTVVDEGGFTRAAEKLHVAQPGVSAQLRQLERELGQPLLDRTGRTPRLTQAGAAVLPRARAALAAVEGARTAVDELTGLLRGSVAMGVLPSCGPFRIADLLADFHHAHPGVEVTLTESDAGTLIRGVREGGLDLALIAFGSEVPAGLDVQTVVDEELVAAVGHGDPLAGRDSVPLAALAERALISLPPGGGMRTILDQACAAAGVSPRIVFEASDPGVLADLAARGLGVAIVPSSGAARADLHGVRIVRPRLHGSVALAWRAAGTSGPAARAFVEHAREALRGYAGAAAAS
ncbi:LysR family transcriptional regulator [Prauserella cavernicola]|uniref:LysR family transcriptional regulator n=1 Tax=Prauserella cavernicola TaxID=2800127 RepID=A0A934QXG3_9PSEU|nr:LysR substrate-binding domain-containing protein [Prauserella cavernicola]MBK1788283.1 LysR family transcriptional regulator [Prauserella cavernicola]